MTGFSEEVKRALWGQPFADAADVVPPPYDGRTAALGIFRKYVLELAMYRQGGLDANKRREPPILFRLAPEDVHVEWPEEEASLRLPAVALLAQEPGEYRQIGLTTNVVESSRDRFGKGTVLLAQAEVVENFAVEIWSRTKQERRALVFGIESAMTPLVYMAGLRFVMPDYYGQLATFSLQTREVIDDDGATFARRKARLVVRLSYVQVSLVRAADFRPVASLSVAGQDEALDFEAGVAERPGGRAASGPTG